MRESAAVCLYAVHKLRGEVARHEAVAAAARDAARRALDVKDVVRSRAMVTRARTSLDITREVEAQRAELRASADAALEALRRLGESIASLERDRLRALVVLADVAAAGAEVEEARRTLEVREAERRLELELL